MFAAPAIAGLTAGLQLKGPFTYGLLLRTASSSLACCVVQLMSAAGPQVELAGEGFIAAA
jgi:hypothetical protein